MTMISRRALLGAGIAAGAALPFSGGADTGPGFRGKCAASTRCRATRPRQGQPADNGQFP